MKTSFAGSTYAIEFSYGTRVIFLREKPEPVETETTTCRILDVTALEAARRDGKRTDGWTDRPIVAEATVGRYYKDTPNREKARKAALRAVLEIYLPAVAPSGPHRVTLQAVRDQRKLFWVAYLTRKKAGGGKVASAGHETAS